MALPPLIAHRPIGTGRAVAAATGAVFRGMAAAALLRHSAAMVGPPKRITAISFDVTGTLVAFRGRLGAHYVESARKCGVSIPHGHLNALEEGFRVAYNETHAKYPCFGGVHDVGCKDWWRACVLRSFEVAREMELDDDRGNVGALPRLTDDEQERVFQRIYSTFGSHSAYESFGDAAPFLRWARRRGIVTGIISNADERYADSILPMLDLADSIDTFVFSRDVKEQKPHPSIFSEAIRQADAAQRALARDDSTLVLGVRSEECLHVGNDFEKDWVGATRSGMHAVLLDRFGHEGSDGLGQYTLDGAELSEEGKEWRSRGAVVCSDLLDVLEYLARSGVELGPPKKPF